MTIEEKKKKIARKLGTEDSIEEIYEKVFGKEEQMKAITPSDLFDAGAKAATVMVHKEPATILIMDQLATATALTARILFDEKEEK